MRPLIQTKTTNVNLEGIEFQLKRIADILEVAFAQPNSVPYQDFDPDDYSEVLYVDEEQELIDQHLKKRVGGVVVDGPGLY